MEAIAALGVAGNSLQLVEFVAKVLSKASGLKRSHDGTIKEHSELEAVKKDLMDLMSQLGPTNNPSLNTLVEDCSDVGKELAVALEKIRLKGPKNLFTTYRRALSIVWHQSKLEELEERVNRLRSQIGFHIQMLSGKDILRILQETHSTNTNITETTATLTTMNDRMQGAAHSILEELNQTSTATDALSESIKQLQNSCMEILSRISNMNPSAFETTPCPSASEFLDTLQYRFMQAREESIRRAHAQTFQWLIMDPDDVEEDQKDSSSYAKKRLQLRTAVKDQLEAACLEERQIATLIPQEKNEERAGKDLQSWLKSGDGLFWIYGKPGCGKSTLMKTMKYNNLMSKRLRSLLSDWAGNQNLIIASHFFYRPGSSLQKSYLGMLSSLLYQILSKNQNIVEEIFDRRARIDAISRLQQITGSEDSVWSLQELQQAFQNLRQYENLRIYLHIDGIDEMEGCSSEEIAEILYDIASSGNIKLLLAGRWTPEFASSFRSFRWLNLHKITELDVLHFTVDKLHHHDLSRVLNKKAEIKKKQFMKIVQEIVYAADGVFLWVKIVVQSLLEGANRYESFEDLFKRLEEYPRDLDELYWFLHGKIDDRYMRDAASWLLGVYNVYLGAGTHGNSVHVTPRILACAEHYDPSEPNSLYDMMSKVKNKQIMTSKNMANRIKAQCPHFFEYRSNKIVFAHRTVLDFVAQSAVQDGLRNQLHERQNPYLGILAATIVCQFLRESLAIKENLVSVGKNILLSKRLCPTEVTKLNTQLINFFKHSQLGKFTKYRLNPMIMPSYEGWHYGTTTMLLAKRLEQIGIVAYAARFYVDATSKERDRLMQTLSMLSSTPTCAISSRYNIFLSWQYDTILDWDKKESTLSSAPLFEIELQQDRLIWKRCLEYVRIMYAKSAADNGGSFDTIRLHCLSIPGLIRHVANINELCRGIWLDTDKSELSALSLFKRLESSHMSRIKSNPPCDADPFLSIFQRCLDHLSRAGAVERVVPFEEHGRDQIVPLDYEGNPLDPEHCVTLELHAFLDCI